MWQCGEDTRSSQWPILGEETVTIPSVSVSIRYKVTSQWPLLYKITSSLELSAMPSFYFSLVTAGISWVIWCLTRNFFQRSPLDNIPGPRSPSFTRGMWPKCYRSSLTQIASGNLGQLFHRDGWAFHDSLTTQYNSAVVRLTGFFGVRSFDFAVFCLKIPFS